MSTPWPYFPTFGQPPQGDSFRRDAQTLYCVEAEGLSVRLACERQPAPTGAQSPSIEMKQGGSQSQSRAQTDQPIDCHTHGKIHGNAQVNVKGCVAQRTWQVRNQGEEIDCVAHEYGDEELDPLPTADFDELAKHFVNNCRRATRNIMTADHPSKQACGPDANTVPK